MGDDKFAPESVSARCLGRQSRSGVAVAKLMRGEKIEQERSTAPQRKYIKKKFTDPSEFLAGPGQPGRITHGPRRFHGTNKDTVGKMLSDDFIMGENGAIVVGDKIRGKQLNNKSYLTHLTNFCDVTEEPLPFRAQIRVNTTARKADVPFSLENDTRPLPKGEKAGKRQYKDSTMMRNFILGIDEHGKECVPDQYKGTYRLYQSNKSVDVLNLGKYNPEVLKEVRPAVIKRGPRRCEPPEMPPRRRPQIRPMRVAAKEVHDVLGTGLWGKPVEVKQRCRARGTAHASEENHIFGGVILQEGSDGEANGAAGNGSKDGHRAANLDLLRYYDPTLDAPAAEPSQKRKNGNRSNLESNPDVPAPRTGKGKGYFYDRYARESPGLLEYA